MAGEGSQGSPLPGRRAAAASTYDSATTTLPRSCEPDRASQSPHASPGHEAAQPDGRLRPGQIPGSREWS